MAVTINWNGDTNGLLSPIENYFRVSSDIFTSEELTEYEATVVIGDTVKNIALNTFFDGGAILEGLPEGILYFSNDLMFAIDGSWYMVLIATQDISVDGIEALAGVYFPKATNDEGVVHYVSSLTIINAKGEDKDYIIKESTLTAIADAIRNKKDTSEVILTEDMANEILDITSGIIEVNELPTDNIDTDAAYLCNGFLYRYITDDGSSIGTWTFNKEFTSYVDSSITLDGDYGYFYGPTSTTDGTLTQYPIQTIRSDPYGVAGREYIKFKCSTEIFSQVDSGFSGYPNEWGSNIYKAAGAGYGSGYFDYDDELHRTVIITREIENDALRAHFRANAIKHETGWVRYLSPSGSLTFEENGTFDVTDKVEVVVNVPLPSGSIEITENGTFDITDKEEVIVNIGASSIISNGTMITIDLAPVIQDGENIIIGG